MAPYTPSIYMPNGYGRFRQYPRVVDTPIPGAGYRVGRMMWKEQPLNLHGSASPQFYGNYARVPLRGLGADRRERFMAVGVLTGVALLVVGGAYYLGTRKKRPATPNRRRRRRRR